MRFVVLTLCCSTKTLHWTALSVHIATGYYYEPSSRSNPNPDLNTAITCKLFDFGLSKQLGNSPSKMGLTAGTGTWLCICMFSFLKVILWVDTGRALGRC